MTPTDQGRAASRMDRDAMMTAILVAKGSVEKAVIRALLRKVSSNQRRT
jgi:hypothetical protein